VRLFHSIYSARSDNLFDQLRRWNWGRYLAPLHQVFWQTNTREDIPYFLLAVSFSWTLTKPNLSLRSCISHILHRILITVSRCFDEYHRYWTCHRWIRCWCSQVYSTIIDSLMHFMLDSIACSLRSIWQRSLHRICVAL
jgi:hypothetical protein